MSDYMAWFDFVGCVYCIAGKLVDNKISWRGDSGLKDGSEEGVDLSKGMYDAGDHMKFGLPMAFTATVLSWAILEYGDQMEAVDQMKPARESLKWITDYLINAHPEENVLYIQVALVLCSGPLLIFVSPIVYICLLHFWDTLKCCNFGLGG